MHRDVKPANLMLGDNGIVKLCDLGLAIFTSRQHDVSGSPHYIAPEQALGEDLDGRADLYALGASWVELLSNDTLYTGTSAGDLARKQVEEPIPDLARPGSPTLPDEVGALAAFAPGEEAEPSVTPRLANCSVTLLSWLDGMAHPSSRLAWGGLAPSHGPEPLPGRWPLQRRSRSSRRCLAGDALRAWLPLGRGRS